MSSTTLSPRLRGRLRALSGLALPLSLLLGACNAGPAGPATAPESLGEAQQAASLTCITIERGNLSSIGDSTLDGSNPTTNYGAAATLTASSTQEVVISADMTQIPWQAVIVSAKLTLHTTGPSSAGLPINLHRMTGHWHEGTATYSVYSTLFDPAITGTISPTDANPSADVKPLVQAWVNATQPNYGMLLETTDTNATVYASSESATAALLPSLDVCYGARGDFCAATPCQNAGTCTNGAGGYTCACAPGFTGVNCEINIDDCVGNACQNGGVCVDGVNSYTCQCPAGYSGVHCEVVPAPCESGDPCNLNTMDPVIGLPQGAACTDTAGGGYTCQCNPFTAGANCDVACPCVDDAVLAGDFNTALPWAYSAFLTGFADACTVSASGTTTVDLNGSRYLFSISLNPTSCSVTSGTPLQPYPLTAAQHAACQTIVDLGESLNGFTCTPDPCDTLVCQHGGACSLGACACTSGWVGTSCEIPFVSTLILPGNPGGGDNGGDCSVPVGTGTLSVQHVAGQTVVVSGDSQATTPPSFDDLAVITVTSPTNQVAKLNAYIFSTECADPSGPLVDIGGTPIDITALFGAEVGTFTVQVDVRNGGNGYYSWNDTWLGFTGP